MQEDPGDGYEPYVSNEEIHFRPTGGGCIVLFVLISGSLISALIGLGRFFV
jgi:hypothetical protein